MPKIVHFVAASPDGYIADASGRVDGGFTMMTMTTPSFTPALTLMRPLASSQRCALLH